jgi:UDP-glucose:(heptosyl)LPS alpha-1,3-glucosyltransferase
MRIALVIYTFSQSRGGAERSCFNLARGLAARGHELHLYSARFADEDVPRGAVVHRVETDERFSWRRHRTFAENCRELLREVSAYDIVHSFSRTIYQDVLRLGGGTHTEFLERTASRRSAIGRLWTRLSLKHRSQIELDRRAMSEGAYRRIVAVWERGRQNILRQYPVRPEHVVVIRNGVDLDRFSPMLRSRRDEVRRKLGYRKEEVLYLFCARNALLKGLDTAIEALARLPKDLPARLLSVGERHDAPLRWLARRKGVADRVTFLGPQPAMEGFYGAADVLVHPSRYDPSPNVCLEAMASGLPVITTSCVGAAELMADGREGFIVEPGDAAELAGRMEALAEPGLRARAGRAARRTAESRSMERVVEENLALYKEVYAEKHEETKYGRPRNERLPAFRLSSTGV